MSFTYVFNGKGLRTVCLPCLFSSFGCCSGDDRSMYPQSCPRTAPLPIFVRVTCLSWRFISNRFVYNEESNAPVGLQNSWTYDQLRANLRAPIFLINVLLQNNLPRYLAHTRGRPLTATNKYFPLIFHELWASEGAGRTKSTISTVASLESSFTKHQTQPTCELSCPTRDFSSHHAPLADGKLYSDAYTWLNFVSSRRSRLCFPAHLGARGASVTYTSIYYVFADFEAGCFGRAYHP